VTLGLLGSHLGMAQAASGPDAAAETSLTRGITATDTPADEPSPGWELAEDDPETAPSAEDIALGAQSTVEEPVPGPDTAEDGEFLGLTAGHQLECDRQREAAAQQPGAQYAACPSDLQPAAELDSAERAALSQLDAPVDTAAAESAILAAAPDAEQVEPEAVPDGTAEETLPASSPSDELAASAAAAGRSPWREPKWCIDEGVDSTWYLERMRGCGIFRSGLTVVDVRTGRPIGGIKYLIVGYSFSKRLQEVGLPGQADGDEAVGVRGEWHPGVREYRLHGQVQGCGEELPVPGHHRQRRALRAVLHGDHHQHGGPHAAGNRPVHRDLAVHQPCLARAVERGKAVQCRSPL
jgi:hypothetical protein